MTTTPDLEKKSRTQKRILLIVSLLILGCLSTLFMLVGPGVHLLAKLGVQPVCIQGDWSALKIVPCSPVEETFKTLSMNSPINMDSDARPLIIDTDMAPDDWMAIIYLLRRPDINVTAITVTGVGETHCSPGVKNALALVAFTGRKDIPVACGRQTPLKGEHTFPDSWRQRADSLAGLSLPLVPDTSDETTASQVIEEALLRSQEKTTLVALGPLTNLAEVFSSNPDLVQQVQMIYIMGGAFDVAGNVGLSNVGIDNQSAEWNIYIDPYAANRVIQSGAPITFIPLDATNQVPITVDFYRRLSNDRSTQSAEFVFQLLTRQYDLISQGLYWFWDPLAAVISTNEDLGVIKEFPVYVIEEEGPDIGATIRSESGASIRVVIETEAPRFEILFLDVLNDRFP